MVPGPTGCINLKLDRVMLSNVWKLGMLKPVETEDRIMATANIKQALHHMADVLPEDATWKDVAYEAYVRQEMEAGLAEAQRGEFTDESEVKNTFARWGVQIEG